VYFIVMPEASDGSPIYPDEPKDHPSIYVETDGEVAAFDATPEDIKIAEDGSIGITAAEAGRLTLLLSRVGENATLWIRPPRQEEETPLLSFYDGGVELNKARRECLVEGKIVRLSPKEYEVLRILLEKPGEVVEKDYIQNRVWGEGYAIGGERLLDVPVMTIRKKIGAFRGTIKTVRGVGIMFDDQLSPEELTKPSENPLLTYVAADEANNIEEGFYVSWENLRDFAITNFEADYQIPIILEGAKYVFKRLAQVATSHLREPESPRTLKYITRQRRGRNGRSLKNPGVNPGEEILFEPKSFAEVGSADSFINRQHDRVALRLGRTIFNSYTDALWDTAARTEALQS
jgi:DNA-binding winged helix-turn-helix (wHTH) protein